MRDDQIYLESYNNIKDRQEGSIKNSINSIPIKDFRYFFIIALLAVVLMVWTDKIEMKWLWWTLAGIIAVIALLGYQNRDANSHITQLEAKSILLRDLRFLKRSGAKEFEGLTGDVDTFGPCYHDNSSPDTNKWVWVIGWRHILPNRRIKQYTAQIYSKVALAKVRALSLSMGEYMGEEMITSASDRMAQPAPKEVNYYFPGQDGRRPFI